MQTGLFVATCLTFLVGSFQVRAQVRFELVTSEVLQNRLDLYKGNDQVREVALFKMFGDAGCSSANLSEQTVPKQKAPNVICVLPGETAQAIVIGAHFDHVPQGSGIIDNWSGASLLPSLFQSLLGSRRKHTFILIGFTGEELGEIGSRFYVKHLSRAELSEIDWMITVDSIGLGPTKVWVSRSDKHALALLNATAHAMKLPLGGMNADSVGESDEEPFIEHGIKTIMIHSITNQNLRVLHSELDAPRAIDFNAYYDTYHLLAGYLAVLDGQSGTMPSASTPEH